MPGVKGTTGASAKPHAATEFAATPMEKVREYWDARPCNIRHSAREIDREAKNARHKEGTHD